METEKKKRGRPPKHKAMEFEGMTYEGAINHALDQVVRADLDKCLANKDESQLTDDERKYLKRKPSFILRDAARLGKKPKTPKNQTKGRSKKQGIE